MNKAYLDTDAVDGENANANEDAVANAGTGAK